MQQKNRPWSGYCDLVEPLRYSLKEEPLHFKCILNYPCKSVFP